MAKEFHFGVVDYIFFVAMLLLSAMTGVYFGFRHKCFKNKPQDTIRDYLTGNRNLKVFPVAMSLIASYISGVTMLGTPAEVYNFGAQYWLIVFAMAFSSLTVAYIYLPVFTTLQVCSSYEYLELRFNKTLRTAASICFLFDEIMFLPMLIYVPSIAFSQVTGISIYIIGVIVCAVCVFYTILGGLKAVVYTDMWQTLVMFFADMIVIIVGIVAIGGFGVIIDRGIEGNRLQKVNFSPSMYERYTFFSVIIGGYTYWTSFNSVNQTMVQRYLSLPDIRKAKFALAIFTFGCIFFISMCCFAGVLIYGTYQKCDPFTANRIERKDQLLPLFVIETAGHLPGISGLFIAGVFGAALSSLSVVLNSSAVVLLEDFFRGLCHFNLTESGARTSSKFIIFILGIVACCLVLVVERMSGIFEVTTSLSSIAAGTMFGIFTLGMLIPWCNEIGAIAGGIAGFIMSCVISFGSQYVSAKGWTHVSKQSVSVENCFSRYNINVTNTTTSEPVYEYEDIFPLFRLSYLWITPIGVSTVLIVGIAVSFCTGKTDLSTIDPELISPVCHWLLPKEAQDFAGSSVRRLEHLRLLEGFTSLASFTSLRSSVHSGDPETSSTKK